MSLSLVGGDVAHSPRHDGAQDADASVGEHQREMRVATLTEPFATLMRLRAKRLETRGGTFARSYRGECAIQAGKGWPRKFRDLCAIDPFYPVLRYRLGRELNIPDDDPRLSRENLWRLLLPTLGQIIALGRIAATFWTADLLDENQSQHDSFPPRRAGLALCPQPIEQAFGNYARGRLALEFRQVRPLARPEPVVGNLGLWRLNGLQASRVRRSAIDFDEAMARVSHRAGGEAVCPFCQRLFQDHPEETEVLSDQGRPFLVRACDGELLKL